MARIRINKLPEGYEVKNGKVIKTMKSGGYVTGDQHNWGLVTVPPLASDGSEIGRPASEPKLRYSLNPVPRDEATVEAEKGETVLTDLNEDGKFELYKILGRRHTGGGTPLNLPPQSFIYSDTAKSRLPKAQLAELGVSAKKMITPAVASMNFELNPYVGILADPTTDKIGETGAELMLDKNKHSLSHLAFLQESRKKFKEGVPLASHPYLVSQGQDPIEFSMKVEEINRKEAEDAAIAQLPLEEQQKILMLRQFMEQAQTQEQQQGQQQGQQPPMEAQGQPMQQQMQPPPGMAPQGQPMSPEMMARCGGEHRYLPKAQSGGGYSSVQPVEKFQEGVKPFDVGDVEWQFANLQGNPIDIGGSSIGKNGNIQKIWSNYNIDNLTMPTDTVEYNIGSGASRYYDPVTNQWTDVAGSKPGMPFLGVRQKEGGEYGFLPKAQLGAHNLTGVDISGGAGFTEIAPAYGDYIQKIEEGNQDLAAMMRKSGYEDENRGAEQPPYLYTPDERNSLRGREYWYAGQSDMGCEPCSADVLSRREVRRMNEDRISRGCPPCTEDQITTKKEVRKEERRERREERREGREGIWNFMPSIKGFGNLFNPQSGPRIQTSSLIGGLFPKQYGGEYGYLPKAQFNNSELSSVTNRELLNGNENFNSYTRSQEVNNPENISRMYTREGTGNPYFNYFSGGSGNEIQTGNAFSQAGPFMSNYLNTKIDSQTGNLPEVWQYGGQLPKAQDGAEMDYNTWLSKFKETEEYEELWEYYYVKKDELGEGWLENELQKTYRKVFGISANIIPPTDNVFKGVDLDINFKIFEKGGISPPQLETLSDSSYTTQGSFIQTESVDDDISSGNYETLNISSTQRDGEYDWIWQILEYENEFGADGVTGVANWGWTDPSGKWKKAEAALAQKENRESRFLSDGKVTKQEAYDMFIDFIIPQFDPSFLPGGANYNPQVLKDLASYMFNSSRKYEDVLLRAANVHANASDLNNPYDPQLWIDNKAKITALMKDSNVVQLVNNAMADAYNTQRGHTLQKPHPGAANWINHRMKKQWNSTGAQATQAQGGPGATGTTEATGATGTTEVTTKKDLNARYQQIEDLYYDPRMEETRNHMYDLFKSKVAQDIKAGKKYASDYKKFANDDKNEYKEEFEEATLRMQKGNLYQQEYYGDDVLKRTEEVSKYNAGAGGKYYNEQLKNAGWTEGEITPYDIGLGQYGFGLMADMQKAGLLKNTLLTISYTGDPKANESSYRSGTGEKISAISNIDRKAGSKTLYENWVINPDTPSLEEEPDGTIPVKPEPLKVPDFIPQSADVNTPFWLQDMIGMGTAISNKYGVNKYYPWAPMINKPSMEPVFDDPTRRIAAINEQKTISDQARAMYSGPQSLAAFTGKSSGQGMKGIADTVDRVNRYNVDTANKFALLNTNMDLSTQQLNNATRTKLYDDTMAVDQNYDNAMIQANTEIAKQIQNAFTNRANTANLNSLFEGYNVHPETGGFVRHTGSPRSIYGTYPRKTREEEVSEIYKNWDRDYPEKDMPSGYLDYILGTQKTRRNNSQYDPYGVYGESAYNENLTDSQIEYLNLIRAGGYQQ